MDRPEGLASSRRQSEYLPSGGELAVYLAENFGYPLSEAQDLASVSRYAALMVG